MTFDDFLMIHSLNKSITESEFDKLKKKYEKLRFDIEKKIDESRDDYYGLD